MYNLQHVSTFLDYVSIAFTLQCLWGWCDKLNLHHARGTYNITIYVDVCYSDVCVPSWMLGGVIERRKLRWGGNDTVCDERGILDCCAFFGMSFYTPLYCIMTDSISCLNLEMHLLNGRPQRNYRQIHSPISKAFLKTFDSLLRPLHDDARMFILSFTGRENVLKFRVPQHVTKCKMVH